MQAQGFMKFMMTMQAAQAWDPAKRPVDLQHAHRSQLHPPHHQHWEGLHSENAHFPSALVEEGFGECFCLCLQIQVSERFAEGCFVSVSVQEIKF